ncbi:uncharacterized protein UTRI_04767_B [Ustilago trichophora]|uniref:Uncharacterized protein n=1 Tax=Ustilago trichophora TaxID=86804 RepID=A0A5C3EG59_9BASI|nr:uncharacterized protein UTRI_04767_B [Ustilago trichophora]
MVGLDALATVLGSSPNKPEIQTLLNQVGASSTVDPEIKAYPDVVYHNYQSLGLSLQYEAATPGTDASKATADALRLAAIDIYSAHEDKRWTGCPGLPLQISATHVETGRKTVEAIITHDSTGKALVSLLGEPERKGGGAGGRSGPAAWMEWSLRLSSPDSDSRAAKEVKVQVELAGAGARGADRWNAERAGACQWAVITIS